MRVEQGTSFRRAVILALFSWIVPVTAAMAQESEFVNKPVSPSGLTGLIATTIPYTLGRGVVEIGVSTLNETSAVPEYTIEEYPLSLTVGVSNTAELAVRGSYLYREEGPGTPRKRGAGDSELSLKWNLFLQQEGSMLPSSSLIVTVLGSTGDTKDGLNRVQNWGAKAGFSVGRELEWEDQLIGIYADAQIFAKDVSKDTYRDSFGIYNIGFLLPVSKRHNLQLLLEYSGTSGKRFADIDGFDNRIITYGVRLVTGRLNITVGDQIIRKEVVGEKSSSRLISTASVKF